MEKDKKELERSYLSRFAEVSRLVPTGRIRDFERPDFLVETDSVVIGIELTRLFQKGPQGSPLLKEQESLWERTITRAKEIYDRLNIAPIHVNVNFNRSAHFRKSDVERVAQKLAALAQRLIPNPNEFSDEEYDWENRDYFPEEVNRISLGRFASLKKSFWGQAGGNMIPELSTLEIQKEIEIKNKQISAYLKSCAQVWLLLCCHGEGMASWFDISGPALHSVYRSRFNRIFWFSFQGEVHELRVEL